ncbi:WD40 repeat domain-containing protein [Geomonas sp. RF6]|uniref:WD40 repeat domain-containing protein n=1 Tax=Geomonas sp. RF6 TaxID=2897342 RepID=UPI001E5A2492|nr:WD40 repeat domain-containing protein [Geomonas sp. RF6]UFS71371.1 WD40 repeat domain-containing protein [Geomonas sp. RF6]
MLRIIALFLMLFVMPGCLYAGTTRYAPIEPHHDNVYAARFTSDGNRVVSVDTSDGVLIEWDFLANRILRRVKAPFTTADMGVALTRDAAKAAFVAADGRVVTYDLASGKFRDIPLHIPRDKDPKREACCIAISDDGSALFVGDSYGVLYRSEGGKPFVPFASEGKINIKNEQVTALSVSPDSRRLAVGRIGMIRVIDAGTGAPVWMIPHDEISFSASISFSPDGRFISAGIPGRITLDHANQDLLVWEVEGGGIRHNFRMVDGMAFFGGFSRDGKTVLAASSRSSYLFDFDSGKQIGYAFRPSEVNNSRFQMDMSPDGRYLLITGVSGLLKVYEVAKILVEKEPEALVSLESRVSKVEALEFSPDGMALLISHETAMPQVFDLQSKKMLERLDDRHNISSFRFSNGGQKVVAVGKYHLGQWMWPSLTALPGIEFEDGNVQLGVSADGTTGVSLARDVLKYEDGINWRIPELQMLDLTTGKTTKKFLLRDLQDTIARFYELRCIDFVAETATVLDTDGRGRDPEGHRPSTWNSPDRALVYSLVDGSRLREIAAGSHAGSCSCEKGAFEGAIEGKAEKEEPLHHYKLFVSGRYSMRSDNGLIIVKDNQGQTSWRVETFATPFESWEHSNQIEAMAISSDGKMLAIGTNKGDVGLYNVHEGRWIGTYLYLGYKEWIWYTRKGIANSSAHGMNLVQKEVNASLR